MEDVLEGNPVEDLQLSIDGLGGLKEDLTTGRKEYTVDPDCENSLRDIIRYLRNDDPLIVHQIVEKLYNWNVLHNHFLPIWYQYHYDEKKVKLLLQIFTMITLFRDEENEQKYIHDLVPILYAFKKAFTTAPFIRSLHNQWVTNASLLDEFESTYPIIRSTFLAEKTKFRELQGKHKQASIEHENVKYKLLKKKTLQLKLQDEELNVKANRSKKRLIDDDIESSPEDSLEQAPCEDGEKEQQVEEIAETLPIPQDTLMFDDSDNESISSSSSKGSVQVEETMEVLETRLNELKELMNCLASELRAMKKTLTLLEAEDRGKLRVRKNVEHTFELVVSIVRNLLRTPSRIEEREGEVTHVTLVALLVREKVFSDLIDVICERDGESNPNYLKRIQSVVLLEIFHNAITPLDMNSLLRSYYNFESSSNPLQSKIDSLARMRSAHSQLSFLRPTNNTPNSVNIERALNSKVRIFANTKNAQYEEKTEQNQMDIFDSFALGASIRLSLHQVLDKDSVRTVIETLKNFIAQYFPVLLKQIFRDVTADSSMFKSLHEIMLINFVSLCLYYVRTDYKLLKETVRRNITDKKIRGIDDGSVETPKIDLWIVRGVLDEKCIHLFTAKIRSCRREGLKNQKGLRASLRAMVELLRTTSALLSDGKKNEHTNSNEQDDLSADISIEVANGLVQHLLESDVLSDLLWILNNLKFSTIHSSIISFTISIMYLLLSYVNMQKHKRVVVQKITTRRVGDGDDVRLKESAKYEHVTLDDLIERIMANKIISVLVTCLGRAFAENPFTVHSTVGILNYIISKDSSYVTLLFQMDYFLVFLNLMEKNSTCAGSNLEKNGLREASDFASFVVSRFTSCYLKSNKCLALELMFRKAGDFLVPSEMNSIFQGYSGDGYEQSAENIKSGNDMDVVRNQIMRRRATGGVEWTEEDDKQLESLWDSSQAAVSSIKHFVSFFDGKKKIKHIEDRLKVLGLLLEDGKGQTTEQRDYNLKKITEKGEKGSKKKTKKNTFDEISIMGDDVARDADESSDDDKENSPASMKMTLRKKRISYMPESDFDSDKDEASPRTVDKKINDPESSSSMMKVEREICETILEIRRGEEVAGFSTDELLRMLAEDALEEREKIASNNINNGSPVSEYFLLDVVPELGDALSSSIGESWKKLLLLCQCKEKKNAYDAIYDEEQAEESVWVVPKEVSVSDTSATRKLILKYLEMELFELREYKDTLPLTDLEDTAAIIKTNRLIDEEEGSPERNTIKRRKVIMDEEDD